AHGNTGWEGGGVELAGEESKKCVDCHNPHNPRIALLDITKPHPSPKFFSGFNPADIPPMPLALIGISLSILAAAGFAASRVVKR
ncbi:MAG: hypothetical protein U1D67_09155, partial [Dehalococcoidia bacterium]|nr:hypothetical protein [Dehalococcoidia bacterium]